MPLSERFPGWPVRWRGATLRRVKLTDRERPLARGFDGPVALFDDGRAQLLLRYTERPTRYLQPAVECLRGDDWRVTLLADHIDGHGSAWASFRAEKQWQRCVVRECVFDQSGRSWTNAASWYWSALFGATRGPWWAVVTMEEL